MGKGQGNRIYCSCWFPQQIGVPGSTLHRSMHAEVLRDMKERRMIRTSNAIPSDLGEPLATDRLGLELAPNAI